MHISRLFVWCLVGACAGASSSVFSPLQFGAIGDGLHVDTDAVRKAAKAAAAAAPGSVLLFPSGYTFLTSAFNISASGTTLRVQENSTIVALASSDDWPQVPPLPWYGGPSDYQQSGAPMRQGFIYSDGANDIVLTGTGTVDGNGSAWWNCWEHDKLAAPCLGVGRPHLIQLTRGSNVSITDLRIQNSPCWTVHPSMIRGLVIERLRIHNPPSAPNTDGMDLDCVQDAVVRDCDVAVGDDALCVKSGIDFLGRTFGRESRNITFERITIGTGHGISIGSESSGGVDGVVFRDIQMTGTERGGRIKSQRGRGGLVRNIVFENLAMDGVGTAFDFNLNYHTGLKPTNETATPRLANVTARSVRAAGAGTAWAIDGLPESIIRGLQFDNVSVAYSGGSSGHCEMAAASCSEGPGLHRGTATCPRCNDGRQQDPP